MFPPKSSRSREIIELDKMMQVPVPKRLEQLSVSEINSVDALCMGPADPESNSRYHAIWPSGWWKLAEVKVEKG